MRKQRRTFKIMKTNERHIFNALYTAILALTVVFCLSLTFPDDDVAAINPEPEILIAGTDRDGTELRLTSAEDALRYMEKSPHSDDYMRGILPKMTHDELDYAVRLLNNTHDGFIVVDKGRMKVIKYNRYGDEEVSFGMACAKNYGTKHAPNDCRTPEGFFSVRKIHNSTDWHYTDEFGNVSAKTGEYGPRFIRLNTPMTRSIGIHGTCAPWSIGGRRSHGCIRIKNENILRLVEMVDSGMPVIISPGKKDMAVNSREGYDIPHIDTVMPSESL